MLLPGGVSVRFWHGSGGTALAPDATIGKDGKGRVNGMDGLSAIAFAMACGFTAAGFTASLYRLSHSGEAGFRALFDSPSQVFWSFLLCTFAGPWIILRASLHVWRGGAMPTPWLAFPAAICALWSFCSGVFIVQMSLLAALALHA
jgi:hypothetical protein